ncbi:zinc finger protein 568-like [Sipha flava]|uniref:PR domain zinc finger protein n=1 Tax=Sipha flava TaxID=143950 RepID=A0A2S2QH12_9HEMI|nr:zinc finger protein 568-like [Sipha flava]
MDQPTDGERGTRAVAAAYLPANCCTAPVDVADVLRSHNVHRRADRSQEDHPPPPCSGNRKYKMLVSANDEGRLVCENAPSSRCPAAAGCSCWILSVPLAEDCHTYNCRLALLAASGTVVLHTTAAVLPGQPLKMWFPHDLQLMLHVPFLTPVNIRDERMYVCHECGYACEKPNPLKIHLALDCGRSPRAELWSRLVAATGGVDRTIEASFRFSLSPAESRASAAAAAQAAQAAQAQRPKSSAAGRSAFRPYSPESSASSDGGGCAPPPMTSGPSPTGRTPLPPYERGGGGGGVHDGDAAFFDRRCAEMETIVSNLGHSDQGHLCIYCGKVYSRKYGLKIHIRTHTGFKPLKCKYCYRPFGDPSNLNKHVRLHAEGDTPYKCDCCGKILVRKRDLDRHMKSRHARTMPKSLFKMHVPV